jgi:hypothetical protein
MQRVLDLDLDAFIFGKVHHRPPDGPRLDGEEYPPWSVEQVVGFLESNCGLTSRLPGFAVEHHGELFHRWRDAIDCELLKAPFHVTHVDAHADLGLGDCGYIHLLTELLALPLDARRDPRRGDDALGDGNYLAFALANRWIGDLTYVIGGRMEFEEPATDYEWQPGDLLPYLFKDSDLWSRTFELPTLERHNLLDNLTNTERLRPLALEPHVPYSWTVCREFRTTEPFDLVCIARSPAYTPAAADAIYEEIRSRYIDELR